VTTTKGGEARASRWLLTRSRLAFALGSGILIHEVAIREGGDRPYILLAALSLCGFASFLKLDEILRNAGISINVAKRDKNKSLEEGEVEPPDGRQPAP
jgi:hypothetical protein